MKVGNTYLYPPLRGGYRFKNFKHRQTKPSTKLIYRTFTNSSEEKRNPCFKLIIASKVLVTNRPSSYKDRGNKYKLISSVREGQRQCTLFSQHRHCLLSLPCRSVYKQLVSVRTGQMLTLSFLIVLILRLS